MYESRHPVRVDSSTKPNRFGAGLEPFVSKASRHRRVVSSTSTRPSLLTTTFSDLVFVISCCSLSLSSTFLGGATQSHVCCARRVEIMARSRARSRKGKQQKSSFINSLVEDVPALPGSWPVEIPTSMTHIFRVKPLPNPDETAETTNPFASAGPLEMVEHIFQLEKTAFCDAAVEAPAADSDSYTARDITDSQKLSRVARSDFSTPARFQDRRSTLREAELSGCDRPPSLTSGNGSSGNTTHRSHRWLPLAPLGLTPSRSLSPEYVHSPGSVNLSRRSSLAVTELASSRAPSPSASSSQDSSLSSVETLDLVPRSILSARLPPRDDAYIRFGDRALLGAHPQGPQNSTHRSPHPHGHLLPPDLYHHPMPFGHRDFVGRPVQLGHPQGYDHPLDIRFQRPGEETSNGLVVPNHATNVRPSVSHYDQAALASRTVPSIQLDLQYPQMPANVAMHHLQPGPCSLPLVGQLPHFRPDAPENWGHHTTHGHYPHLPTLPPSQAFRDFMADLSHPGQPMVPPPPPLPPVHAPPLRSVPPHVIGFSVPLRPLGYRAAARERNWTAHFEALGSRGRRKKNSRKKDEAEDPVEIKRSEVYQCPMCDRAFERRNGLAIHMKWHYKDHSEDSYIKGLGINIPPLNLPGSLCIPQNVTMAHPPVPQPSLGPDSAPSSSTLSNDASPPMGSLQLSEANLLPARTSSPADGFLLSVSTLDSMPGPITPLATPPPSPGGSSFRPSSLLHLPAGEILSVGAGRARSESTRSMWDLFGSDD